MVLVTRVIDVKKMSNGFKKINNFCQKVVKTPSVLKIPFAINDDKIRLAIKQSDFVIIRLPSLTSILLFKYVKRFHKKYMVEIMGCIWDAFWNHGLSGKIVAPYSFLKMKKIVKNATYATYVTDKFLQNRYPCKGKSIGVSNVDIKRISGPKIYTKKQREKLSLLTAAAVDVRYKGQKYVIKAIKKLNKKGLKYDYYLAGGGRQDYLKKIAERKHVESQIHFLGSLEHDDLLKYMKGVDYYIQPSLQEGLPRSVIEAMSCGCVCFGSNTAGIPELLNNKYIFKRRSSGSIVKILSREFTVPELNSNSRENSDLSKKFLSGFLDKKRFAFYEKIREEVEGEK
ncbi:glycosyltransferase [Candidatus Saccharibacteria bacterium]|nr:glycosyltransferase [Candidatus Saccharibacteria bacterium]